MKKMFFPVVMVLVLLAAVLVPQQGLAASELDKINQQLEQLRKAKAAAKKKANNTESRIKSIQVERTETKKDINQLLAQIEAANQELGQLNTLITSTETDLKESEHQLEEAIDRVIARDELLQSRLRLMYTNGAVSYLEVLLSSTSFTDFLDRYNSLKSLVGQDKEILESNKRDHELIAAKKAEIEGQLVELASLYKKTEIAREKLWVREKEAEVVIASLNSEEEHLETVSEEQEKFLMDALSKEAKLLREKEKIVTYYQGGKLLYPLPQVYRVSSNFGVRIDPVSGRKGAMHNGIDFAAPAGTSILAAESGVVITAGWWGGYGNTVVIDHGGGMWTLYAHARANGIKVEKGQKVKRGDKISEVGTTGNSTGNHLHFEVRLNEKAVEPRNYLNLK